MLDGVLLIDKDAGPTSHDVVDGVRKILKMRKVGHTGTLDPAATGVLPLVLGKGTRLSRYLIGSQKTYRGTVTLGITTDTLDAEGETLEERTVSVEESEIHAALEQFRGEIEQTPPMYSAKKQDGVRLYQLARKGVEVKRDPKPVTIYELTVVEINLPEIVVDVACSAGTYIRVLAADIGEALGCGAHLSALRRTSVGNFSLEQAITLDDLAEDEQGGSGRVIPLSEALGNLPRIDLSPALVTALGNGYQLRVGDLRTIELPEFKEDEALTVGVEGGGVIGVVRSLLPSSSMLDTRRDKRAAKTENVFVR
jgi:tRNA pseudouridine55 synthase